MLTRRDAFLAGAAAASSTMFGSSLPANSAPQQTPNSHSKRHIIELDGHTRLDPSHSPARPSVFRSSPLAIQLAPEELTASENTSPISENEIKNLLGEVFDKWRKATAYTYYLLDLPNWDLGLVDRNVADLSTIAQNGKKWIPYDEIPRAEIVLSVPPPMRSLPPRYQLCVTLDSLGVVVPSAAAQIVSAGFASGILTRLILWKFGDQSTKNFSGELDLLTKDSSALVNGFGDSQTSFTKRFSELSSNRAFQESGFFLGWNAGGDLLSADENAKRAVWKLLTTRFSWEEVGRLTSFGLSYILGFLRVQDAFLAHEPPATNPDQILEKMAKDANISELQQVIFEFFTTVMDAFQRASSAQGGNSRIIAFRDFLSGYCRGELDAAERIFALALKVGYGIGYSDGFLAGYNRGYADGFKQGYAQGYSEGSRINWGNVLHDIASIASSVATVVSIFA